MTTTEKEILKKRFGSTIQQLRKNKGRTLRQVASNCNLDNSKIAKIEDGKFNISLSTIVELARGLDEHPSRLLEGNYSWIALA
jgi:transcriptional regulator with XRE-family HTH domain